MTKKKTYAIVGGDLRQAHLANALVGKDSESDVYAMFLKEDVKLSSRIRRSDDVKLVFPQSDIVVFPLPMLNADGKVNAPFCERSVELEDCLDYLLPETVVLAGMVPEAACAAAYAHGTEIVDYYKREEFTVMNAVATAEGAVEIALRETSSTLFGSTCVVTGYGRIAKVLARLLLAFGAKVRVVARSHSDLAWAGIAGCEAMHIAEFGSRLKDVDVLFNTVPAVILDEEKLSRLGRDCLIIDLASKPGGVDFEIAKTLGLKTIWALSLPGKVAPMTAGEIALTTICNILGERGIS